MIRHVAFECFWEGIRDQDRRTLYLLGEDETDLAWSWVEAFEASSGRHKGQPGGPPSGAEDADRFQPARELARARFTAAWWEAQERRMWAEYVPEMHRARMADFEHLFTQERLLAIRAMALIAWLEPTFGAYTGDLSAAAIVRWLAGTGQWREVSAA